MWIPITIILANVILAILIMSYVSYRRSFRSFKKKHCDVYHGTTGEMTDVKRKRREVIDKMLAVPCEDVYITSYDGKKLHARYYHVADGAPLAIQFHGYRSLAIRDFAGLALECLELSQNIILVDQRSHGESEGKTISFGIKERFDVKSWIEYAISRFGENTDIVLYGISMGAATVLLSSELDLPKNVKGIIADCPFSGAGDIIRKVCASDGIPARIIYPLIKLGAFIFGGFNPDASTPVRAVANTEIPILLIHGEGDDFVPCYMSDKIAAAGKTVTYVKIPEATHALALLYDKENYMNALRAFLDKILEGESKQ